MCQENWVGCGHFRLADCEVSLPKLMLRRTLGFSSRLACFRIKKNDPACGIVWFAATERVGCGHFRGRLRSFPTEAYAPTNPWVLIPPSLFPHKKRPRLRDRLVCCYGEGGIRTHGALANTAVFKTAALNHSTTSPCDKKHCNIGKGSFSRSCPYSFLSIVGDALQAAHIRAKRFGNQHAAVGLLVILQDSGDRSADR